MNKQRIDWDKRIGIPEDIESEKEHERVERISDEIDIYADQDGFCFLCNAELFRWKIETIENNERAVCSKNCITPKARESKHFEDDGAYAD